MNRMHESLFLIFHADGDASHSEIFSFNSASLQSCSSSSSSSDAVTMEVEVLLVFAVEAVNVAPGAVNTQLTGTVVIIFAVITRSWFWRRGPLPLQTASEDPSHQSCTATLPVWSFQLPETKAPSGGSCPGTTYPRMHCTPVTYIIYKEVMVAHKGPASFMGQVDRI